MKIESELATSPRLESRNRPTPLSDKLENIVDCQHIQTATLLLILDLVSVNLLSTCVAPRQFIPTIIFIHSSLMERFYLWNTGLIMSFSNLLIRF